MCINELYLYIKSFNIYWFKIAAFHLLTVGNPGWVQRESSLHRGVSWAHLCLQSADDLWPRSCLAIGKTNEGSWATSLSSSGQLVWAPPHGSSCRVPKSSEKNQALLLGLSKTHIFSCHWPKQVTCLSPKSVWWELLKALHSEREVIMLTF